jgi:hypothetical protein
LKITFSTTKLINLIFSFKLSSNNFSTPSQIHAFEKELLFWPTPFVKASWKRNYAIEDVCVLMLRK